MTALVTREREQPQPEPKATVEVPASTALLLEVVRERACAECPEPRP